MYNVYILKSLKNSRFYIGSTANLAKRFERHNRGSNAYTKNYKPFDLVWNQTYNTRAEAVRRECEIKSWKSVVMIEKLIKRSDTKRVGTQAANEGRL